jgi:Sulfotransferase domain
MLIWLASYPRSGNTMVRILLRHLYGLDSQAVYPEGVPGGVIHYLNMGGQVTDLESLKAGPEPSFVKTHELPSDDSPSLCVIRDGRDVLVSFAHFTLTRPQDAAGRSFEEVLRMLILSKEHFGGWSHNALAWRKRPAPARTVWLRYEDMVERPAECLAAGLDRLGVKAQKTGGTAMSFTELQRLFPSFFRKGKVGAWKEEMSPALHELFWEHHGESMRAFDYGR